MYVQMYMDGCDFVMMPTSYSQDACNPRFKDICDDEMSFQKR